MDPQVCTLPVYSMQPFITSSFTQQQHNPTSSQNSADTKVQGTIKRRNRLKPHQTKVLTHFFLRNPRPTPEERMELTKSTGMNIREIQVWFQNHRAKIKKEKDSPEEFSNYTPLTFFGNSEMLANWQQSYNSLLGEFLPRDFEMKNDSNTSTVDSLKGFDDGRYHLPIQVQAYGSIPLLANSLNKMNQATSIYSHQPQILPSYPSEIFQPLSTSHYTPYDHKDPCVINSTNLDNIQTGEIAQYDSHSATAPVNPYSHYSYFGSNTNIINPMLTMEAPIQSPFPFYCTYPHDYSSAEATPIPISQYTTLPFTPSYIPSDSLQTNYELQNQSCSNDQLDQKTSSSEFASSPVMNLNSSNSDN